MGKGKYIAIKDFFLQLWDSRQIELINANQITTIQESVNYVHPELEVKVQNLSKPFIIISAPGAVGKTTFAKYATNIKKGYYWDLASLKLGDNTFSGTLLETFGVDKISTVLTAISKGEITLFIDSFDEAEIVSGWFGIEKFLTEVIKYAKSSPRPNIIIFSRSETALEIQMKLDEISGKESYSVYQIDYFSEEQAISFIENRIIQKPSNHAKFINPFRRAIKNIFSSIGMGINIKISVENLWQDEEIRCFLGYSPVLETIADFLFDQNYEEIAKQFESKQNVESGLEIIHDFIGRILERDRNKFIKGLKDKVSAHIKGWDDWDKIYSNEDQLKFVLNCVTRQPMKDNVLFNFKIPDWLEKAFTDSLSYFIHNHPFIRDSKFSSPAFRDYTLAKLLMDKNFESTCLHQLTNGNFILTPLFAFFYKEFNGNVCKSGHTGFIYESVSSRTSFDGNSLLTYVRSEDNKTIFEITNTSGQKSLNVLMECLTSDKEALTFYNKLINADINVNSNVVLGRRGGSFDLHNVEIKAKKIIINAKDLIVNCHDNINSILVGDEIAHSDHSLEIIHKGGGEFIINGDGAQRYPWANYYKEYNSSSTENFKDELYSLKRILEPFRKHGKDEFAKQSEFIDNEIIKNISLRKNLLEFMISLEIIKKGSDRKYYLYENVSIKYGISWSGLKSLNHNDNLINFLNDFRHKFPKK